MRVLIVDDSFVMRRFIKDCLFKIGYQDIEEAQDGEEGLTKARTQHFGLIITDWNMPKCNGLEFLRRIRTNPDTANIPVIMVTTRGNKEDVIEAMKAKANNYVVKPFTPEVLKTKIDIVLGLKKN